MRVQDVRAFLENLHSSELCMTLSPFISKFRDADCKHSENRNETKKTGKGVKERFSALACNTELVTVSSYVFPLEQNVSVKILHADS